MDPSSRRGVHRQQYWIWISHLRYDSLSWLGTRGACYCTICVEPRRVRSACGRIRHPRGCPFGWGSGQDVSIPVAIAAREVDCCPITKISSSREVGLVVTVNTGIIINVGVRQIELILSSFLHLLLPLPAFLAACYLSTVSLKPAWLVGLQLEGR
jgi:hypothetical protein